MTPEAKKRLIFTVSFLTVFTTVVIVGLFFSWPHIKDYWARQQVLEVRELMADEDYELALETVKVAYMGNPENPDIVRLIAEIYDQLNPKDAPPFWQQAFELSDSDADLNAWMAAALTAGDIKTAKAQLATMEARGLTGSTYHLYKGQILLSEKNVAGALAEARLAIAFENADPRSHYFFVQVTQYFDDPAVLQEGIQYLWRLARQRDSLGIRSLRNLATFSGNSDADRADIIRLIEGHPLVERDDHLIALKLDYQLPGSNVQANLASAKRYFNESNLAELTKFGRWLNEQGRFNETTQIISMNDALQREDLLLVLLDAMAQQGRWNEIGEVLDSPKLPLTKDFLKLLFLSRVQYETGQLAKAQITWDRAVLAASEQPDSLWFLVKYARQLVLKKEATTALWRLAELPSEQRKAYDELLLQYQSMRDTAGLRQTLRRMAEAYPDDLDVLNDWAYVNLLLKEQVPLSVETAKDIIARNEPFLSNRITLALGLYRMGEFRAALSVLQPLQVDWSKTPAKWRVIYAAILQANGMTDDANQLLQGIRPEELLPEELALIKS